MSGEAVGDVVAKRTGTAILHRLAALLRGGVGITCLHIALHLIACITTGHGPRGCCYLLATATAKLVAKHAPERGANHCTQDLVFILHGFAVGHCHVAALLTGCLDGLGHRFAGQYLGKLGLG